VAVAYLRSSGVGGRHSVEAVLGEERLSKVVGVIIIALLDFIPHTLSAEALIDREPPELVQSSVVVSPNIIDTSVGDQVVTVSLNATDTGSGLSSVKVTFEAPSGYHYVGSEVPGQPSKEQAISVTFPMGEEAGIWPVWSIELLDKAGNSLQTSAWGFVYQGISVAVGNGSFDPSYDRSLEGLKLLRDRGRWSVRLVTDVLACGRGTRVDLQRYRRDGWRKVDSEDATREGFVNGSIFSRFPPARYRAVTRKYEVGRPVIATCGRAISREFRV
jgi:hypothetical protein